MGRSAVHTRAALLDAAVGLFADGGARAVTMSAVARAAGAPSGSVYHRFPDRGSLLAALWQQTEADFREAYRVALGDPTPRRAVEAAAWIVQWCRCEPDRAAVLNAGPHTFDPDSWPEEARWVHHAALRGMEAELRKVTAEVARAAGVRRDEAAFAMFGLPLAVVGQYLRVPEPVPASAVGLVRRLATRLLG